MTQDSKKKYLKEKARELMKKALIGLLVMGFVFVCMIQNAAAAVSDESASPKYYSYNGDKITVSSTPVKGKMYFPVCSADGEKVLFNVNMDDKSDLFTGDSQYVFACKIAVLKLDEKVRTKVLAKLIKPVTREKMVEAVGNDDFTFAEKVAAEYVDATMTVATPVTLPITTQSLITFLGVK